MDLDHDLDYDFVNHALSEPLFRCSNGACTYTTDEPEDWVDHLRSHPDEVLPSDN